MGKNRIKYYAVRKGFIPGIYYSWTECQKQVNKFSGAEFKSFKSLLEAEEYNIIEILLKVITILKSKKMKKRELMHIYPDVLIIHQKDMVMQV